ncbi:MAG: stage 0 sporulation family protein [Oscillospiraceae bacterium]|nr:stage 0 sporulation family protein [Oscillospiraceae bacterium]
MTEVASVKFNDKGKVYFFDPQGLAVTKGDNVVVETAKGLEYGTCVYGNHNVNDNLVVQPLRPVIRLSTPSDDERAATNKQRNIDALALCQERVNAAGLPMKLVSAEYAFDGSQILFFFTSDGRVDFRDLVRELASLFKTHIKLHQIGVRDEAKMLGGLGVCGKQFCCSQFLSDFHPVSIKMAKTQGLSLNPVKISGTCGRLMCCLKYEEDAYQDLVKHAPKVDSFVETPSGKGSIVGINLLRGTAKVRLEEGGDMTLKTFPFTDLDVLGGKSRRAEYQSAKAEGRLEEAGFKPSVIRPSEPRLLPDSSSSFAPRTSAPAPQRGNNAPNRNNNQRNRPRNAPKPAREERDASDAAEPAIRPQAPRPEPVKKNNNRRYWGKKRGE